MSAAQPTLQNYVKDKEGNTVIPASKRPDGTLRKAIRVRPGYIPQDEIPAYQSPAQMSQPKGATKPIGMPSSQPKQQQQKPPGTAGGAGGNAGGKGSNKSKKPQNPPAAATDQATVANTFTIDEAGTKGLDDIRGVGVLNPPSSGGRPVVAGEEGEWQVVGKKGTAAATVRPVSTNKANGEKSGKSKPNADGAPHRTDQIAKKAGEVREVGVDAGASRDNIKQQNRQMGGTGKGGVQQVPGSGPAAAGTAGTPLPGAGGKQKQKQPASNAGGGDKSTKQKSPPASGDANNDPAAGAGIGMSQVAPKSTPAGIVLKQNAPDGFGARGKAPGGPAEGAGVGGASSSAARLRNLKKKLRDIKDLEEKIKAGGVKPNPDQEEKLKKKKQLLTEIKQLESQKNTA